MSHGLSVLPCASSATCQVLPQSLVFVANFQSWCLARVCLCEHEADMLVGMATAMFSALPKEQIKECFHEQNIASANRLLGYLAEMEQTLRSSWVHPQPQPEMLPKWHEIAKLAPVVRFSRGHLTTADNENTKTCQKHATHRCCRMLRVHLHAVVHTLDLTEKVLQTLG